MKRQLFPVVLVIILMMLFSSWEVIAQKPAKGKYTAYLHKVENPKDNTGKVDQGTSTFEDEAINISWSYDRTQLGFVLENKSTETLRVIWDEAAFIDIYGKTSRVFHKGIKYINREEAQPPTPIYANSKLSDLVAPTDYTSYSSGRYGGWESRPIIPGTNTNIFAKFDKLNESILGKQMRVIMPIRRGDELTEYIFSFAIDFVDSK